VIRLGVLVSGRGSNLEAVLRAVATGELSGIRPALVVSNRPGVRALDVAARFGVPVRVLRRVDFGGDGEARDAAIGQALRHSSVDLALLAGYDRVLSPPYFAAYGGRTINVHPSLLPRHGGRGMVGIEVHRSVLAAGDTQAGATVHEVTAELDAGPILAQRSIAVEADDDERTLAARVLREEHRLLVSTLRRLAAEPDPGMASATITAAAAPSGAVAAQEGAAEHA
jgi:phosphoribosylglycinamide formyltransferase-1